MDRVTFLETLKTGRARWNALVTQINAGHMADAPLNDDWMVKDLIAHVSWYEREMIAVMAEKKLVGSDWWNLPLDERNTRIYEANRDRTLADVCAEALALWNPLREAAQLLSDDDLNDARHFAEMPPDWTPWEVIASNLFDHYPDHIPDLEAWIARQK